MGFCQHWPGATYIYVRPHGILAYVPGRGSVEALCYVVIPLTMTAQVEDFVLKVPPTMAIQMIDLICEALPLSLGAMWVIFEVGIIGTVDQTEVYGRLGRGWRVFCQQGLSRKDEGGCSLRSRMSRHWWRGHLEGRSQ